MGKWYEKNAFILLVVVYAHGRRQLHRVWFGHESEFVVDTQSIIDLMLVVYD